MLHRREGARFPQDVMLGIQAKEFNLGFIRPENLVSGPSAPAEATGDASAGLSGFHASAGLTGSQDSVGSAGSPRLVRLVRPPRLG